MDPILFEIQIRPRSLLQQIGLNINNELKDPLVGEILMTSSFFFPSREVLTPVERRVLVELISSAFLFVGVDGTGGCRGPCARY